MDRVAVFVDAGYLYAASIKLITGKNQPRSAIALNYEAFLTFISKRTQDLTGCTLLRIYWYDGTSGAPSNAHRKLAYQPNVKLRLGMVNLSGEQKGVDSLIVLDLANLAQNRAMSDAVLLTGDEDIRVGVIQAQQFGVRVHLIGIAHPNGERNQSPLLQQESDTCAVLSSDDVGSFASRREPRDAPEVDGVDSALVDPANAQRSARAGAPGERSQGLGAEVTARLEDAVDSVVAALSAADSDQIANTSGSSVPPQFDRLALISARSTLLRDLAPAEKRFLRSRLIAVCKSRSGRN